MKNSNRRVTGQDFRMTISKEWIITAAKNHLDTWKNRYSGKRKKDIKFDLRMNHDISLEFEKAEASMGRDLSDDEREVLEERFNSKVVQLYKK